jgi:hypothetical protein
MDSANAGVLLKAGEASPSPTKSPGLFSQFAKFPRGLGTWLTVGAPKSGEPVVTGATLSFSGGFGSAPGIFLTGAATPTIVGRERMRLSLNFATKVQTVPKWCVVLCLALIALLLNNPYMTAPELSGGLNVSHPPSYRATVASSEMQHFTAPVGPLDVVLVQAWAETFRPITNELSRGFLPPTVDAVPPLQFLCSSLWFRPPPAA